MLRLCCAAARGSSCTLLRTSGGPTAALCPRHASSGRGSGSGLKVRLTSPQSLYTGSVQVVAGAVLLSGGAVGGAVGYASVDADFRKSVEDSVPGSDQVLGLLLGPPAPPPKPAVSKLRIPSPVVVTKPKKEITSHETESTKAVAGPPLPPLDVPAPVKAPAPPAPAVVVTTAPAPASEKPKQVSPCSTELMTSKYVRDTDFI